MNKKISPKVIASTAASFAITVVLAMLNYLITPEGRTLFAALPHWLTILALAFIIGLTAGVAGYAKADPARTYADPARDDSALYNAPAPLHAARPDLDGLEPTETHDHPEVGK
jgi:hypothetical protein